MSNWLHAQNNGNCCSLIHFVAQSNPPMEDHISNISHNELDYCKNRKATAEVSKKLDSSNLRRASCTKDWILRKNIFNDPSELMAKKFNSKLISRAASWKHVCVTADCTPQLWQYDVLTSQLKLTVVKPVNCYWSLPLRMTPVVRGSHTRHWKLLYKEYT